MNLTKRKPLRIPKIRNAARGQECTVNSPICNYDNSTTIPAHFNESYAGKGAGQKADDCALVFACSDCHDWLDGRGSIDVDRSDIEWYWRRAYYRTIRQLIDDGVLR